MYQADVRLKEWGVSDETATLLKTVTYSKTTVIIGVSTVSGLFTQEIIEQMQTNTSKPIVLLLSNPTSKVHAVSEDILNWTNGNAIVATGNPFVPVELNGNTNQIPQRNNSYICSLSTSDDHD